MTYANFTVDWTQSANGSPVLEEEWWCGALSLGGLAPTYSVTGPFYDISYDPIYYSSSASSTHWAGYSWYMPSFGIPQTLHEEWANTKVVLMVAPNALNSKCSTGPGFNCQYGVPGGTKIDPIGTAWTGLFEPGENGTGPLLQTGYAYDALNQTGDWCGGGPANGSSCDYGLWWELTPAPAFQYLGGKCHCIGAHASLGDLLNESVTQVPNTKSNWTTAINDLTSGKMWSHTLDIKSFKPVYAPNIMETPTADVPPPPGSHIQQIPYLPGPVVFQPSYVYAASGAYPVSTLFTAGDYVVYTLNQDGPPYYPYYVYNTIEGYSTSTGQITTWNSSLYDYAYV